MNERSSAPQLKVTATKDFPGSARLLQRQCACGQHTQAGGECEECRKKRGETIQRAAVSTTPTNGVPSIVHDVLNSSGQPLDAGSRAFMEPHFGQDFSQVRVHTGSQARDSAQAVNALAYTVGQDIVFGEGQYAPYAEAGRGLLAHELTHVVQQQSIMTKKSGISQPYEPHEIEATKEAENVLRGQRVAESSLQSAGVQFQRQVSNPAVTDTHAEDESVNKVIESFPSCVKKDIGPKIADRKEFLKSMPRYLGPDPNTENHFKAVRQVKVPGDICLHPKAAEPLEKVAEELGDAMPATYVGLGLRNRFRNHDRHSKGLMAHPLGYAVDFRATTNPMISDPRLVKLLDLETGGATHFELDMTRKERRELIAGLGRGDIDPTSARAEHFFDQFEREYERVSQASKDFTTSLPEEARKTLANLKDRYLKIRTDIRQINNQLVAKPKGTKKSVNRSEEEEQKLQEQRQQLEIKKQELEGQLQDIRNQLPKLFAKWLEDIEKKMTQIKSEIEKEVADIHSLPSKRELDEEEVGLKSHSRSAHRSKERSTSKIKSLDEKIAREKARAQRGKSVNEASLGKWNASRDKLLAEAEAEGKEEVSDAEKLAKIKQNRNLLPKKADYDALASLKSALTTDLDFVFGTKKELEVKDPSVTQLVQKGFFTPDPERDASTKRDPRHDKDKYGFNLAFMKLMAQHGFDQGITWSPGSVDPMHFDFVEGVESILDVKAPKKEEKTKP